MPHGQTNSNSWSSLLQLLTAKYLDPGTVSQIFTALLGPGGHLFLQKKKNHKKGGQQKAVISLYLLPRMESRKFCLACRISSVGLRCWGRGRDPNKKKEEAELSRSSGERLSPYSQALLHSLFPNPSHLPLQGAREPNSMRDLNPNESLPLTICGLLGKVFNISSVNRQSTESSTNVNIKFLP